MDTDASNGKVTLAILGEQMKQTNETLRRIERLFEEHIKDDNDKHAEHNRLYNEISKGGAQRDTQIEALNKSVTKLESKDTWGTLIAGGLASLGVAIGILKP